MACLICFVTCYAGPIPVEKSPRLISDPDYRDPRLLGNKCDLTSPLTFIGKTTSAVVPQLSMTLCVLHCQRFSFDHVI